MKQLMQEANSFSKINWACAFTLNIWFYDFVSVYLVDNYIPMYFYLFIIIIWNIIVWKCAWWCNAENGVGGKEMEFFLLNGIKLVKMHSDGKLTCIYLAINIY